jgi:hypothetical protein
MAKAERAFDSIQQYAGLLQTGDLITRTGTDFTSESLRSLNQRNQNYSHCGILSIEHDSAFVYHALGGEWNPDQKLLREPLWQFADPFNNKRLGLFRWKLPDSLNESIGTAARKAYEKGIRFDMDFDLVSNDKMYCAEFVAKTIHTGSNQQLSIPESQIGSFHFIGVDDIFLHPMCIKLHEFIYK